MRSFLTILLVMLVFQNLQPWLRKVGLGRLPGDFAVRWRGRVWYIPLGSAMLLSIVALVIGLLL